MHTDHISYSDSGVDINFASKIIGQLNQTRSHLGQVINSPNDFAGMFSIKDIAQNYDDPVLVSSTDGVGTKLLVAIECDNYDSLGQDLVAMCANDLAVKGAKPLFFLDYFAASNLKQVPFGKIVNSIVQACDEVGCALIGGETAEMPSLYAHKHFDLAGFIVGVVERKRMLGAHRVNHGDVLLGVASGGLHSNGYSLVRKIIFEKLKHRANDVLWQTEKSVRTVADELLAPTKLYVKTIQDILSQTTGLHAAAHITGGGLTHNVARIIPAGLKPNLDISHLTMPPIFKYLMTHGPIDYSEMLKTFNMGVGLVLAVDSKQAEHISHIITDNGELVFNLGHVGA